MSLQDVLLFIGKQILGKAIKDNLPDLHHNKVIIAVRKVFAVLRFIILLLLVRAGIVKPSPKLALVISAVLGFFILVQLSKYIQSKNSINVA